MRTKSKNEHLQLQVGIFFTFGLALVLLAIFLLGSRKGLFTDRYTIFCYFNDISGLRVGSPVQLAGIKVGFVSAISFEEVLVPRDAFLSSENSVTSGASAASLTPRLKPVVKVKTALELDKTYQNRICSDSTASVVTEGLLGDRIVFLTVGCRKIVATDGVKHEQPMPIKNSGVLTQVEELKGFSNLVEQGDLLMRDAQTFVKNTNTLVVNLNKIIHEVNQGQGLAHKLVYDQQVAKTLDDIQVASKNLNASMQNLSSITEKVDGGQGTVGALINDPSLYNEIKTLFGKANRNKLVQSVVQYTLRTKQKDQLK